MCWYCGNPITRPDPIGRSERCDACGRDLRCCRNCSFYDSSSASCKESQAELPSETERANFCDWFRVHPALRTYHEGDLHRRNQERSARDTFLRLFNDES
ncbi:MAG: hypothetical protein N2Z76_06340 [Treponemataceae bacterium]|nr:hypothetical protein [Treponemataceae bacterium]